MKNSLISIIIPVYNVEKYLDKCLKSIINQTYTNLEIILIDDGSKDKSGSICDKFEKEDNRIKVIHTENCGVSHARNTGLELMKGEYYIFIDSDDYIKNNMIENLYNKMVEYDVDISICNVVQVNEIGEIIHSPNITNSIKKMDSKQYVSLLYNKDSINGYPVNKLIKSSCTKDIRFDEKIKHLEDWEYLCRLSKNVKNVVYDDNDYYYYYVMRNSSAVHQKFNESWTTDLIARERHIEFVKLYNEHDRDRFYFDYVITALNTLGLHHMNKMLTKEEKQKLINIKKKYYPIIKHSKNLTKSEKIKLYLKCKMPIFYFKMMNLLKK